LPFTARLSQSFALFSRVAWLILEGARRTITFLIPHISLGGVAKAALYCAHRTSTFLSCAFCEQEGHLAAPPNLLQARSLFLQGWGLIDLPLRASHRKAKAEVEVEGRKDAESDWSVLNLSLTLILLLWYGRALREHRRSSGSIRFSVPRAGGRPGFPSCPFFLPLKY